MKHYLALTGALLLVSGNLAAGSLTETVSGKVTEALAKFNDALNTINTSVANANNNMASSWMTWYDLAIAQYTSLIDRFQQYPMVDLNSLISGRNDLVFERNYTTPAKLEDDPYYTYMLIPNANLAVSQIGDLLNAAAAEMSSQAVPANNCLNQHGASLTSSPITIDRVTDCILAANGKIPRIEANVIVHINADIALAPPTFNLLNLCNVPEPTDSSSSNICLTQYLSRFSQMKSYRLKTSIDSVRSQQSGMIFSTADRCVRLVQNDIRDAVDRVKANFASCLSTSS
ncbi:uncharacterized protein LOC129770145 [Toxorhynchites rutilus septentrionalis]|uniref:uncharacterized protein LOC129770145 n=1 Tax=Toxorhynchites rutilus septentrionalis TaxID=329112 RepID=UPI00247A571C|nr:uncharacterized protein LOC129770145 [Toxorhynchites rutilus septentrionalis]